MSKLQLSNFIPMPFLTKYGLVKGEHTIPMRCAWVQFRGRALLAHHWLR